MARITIFRYKRPAGVTGPDTSPDYAKDALEVERWDFTLIASFGDGEVTLIPQSYARIARPSRRHKWRDAKPGFNGSFWSQMDERHSGILGSEVPFPDDVVAEAKASIVVTLRPIASYSRSIRK